MTSELGVGIAIALIILGPLIVFLIALFAERKPNEMVQIKLEKEYNDKKGEIK